MKMLFSIFKKYLKDFIDKIKFYFPGTLVSYPKHNLTETQVYPYGNNFDEMLRKAIHNSLKNLKFKNEYKIASIGTCFAEEVSIFLKQEKKLGQYVQLEENIWESSVDWGRVYTIKNVRQILEYSSNDKFPIYIEEDKDVFFDPLREQTVKRSKNKHEMKDLIINHRRLSKSVLKQIDVLVITIGQNEFWEDTEKKIYWGVTPPLEIKNKNKKRFIAREADVSENLQDLFYIINKIEKINKSIQFLFTVSPVPSYATFLSDNVISQSFAGKCVLRTTIHELMKKKKSNIFYFPSFEIALAKNKGTFKSDNRHVRFSKVDEILSYLKK